MLKNIFKISVDKVFFLCYTNNTIKERGKK